VNLAGKSIVITGAGGGVGAAMARRFAREEPYGIVVADIDAEAARNVAEEIGGTPFRLDVAVESEVVSLVEAADSWYGPIDLLCLNAGIATGGGVDVPDELWQRTWQVNVMSHVYGARAVLPQMVARGAGYLLHTASAAGLLTNLGAAPYTVTKHAVVALAEWLSITYASCGVTVSCLSPQFIRTPMLSSLDEISPQFARFAHSISLSAEELADTVVAGIEAERFHILPHPEVAGYMSNKATNPEKWLADMRELQTTLGVDPAAIE
jgi:NAD(P)-dependent dehydrogenase (short-subunit alcohol dehydrogenase family)